MIRYAIYRFGRWLMGIDAHGPSRHACPVMKTSYAHGISESGQFTIASAYRDYVEERDAPYRCAWCAGQRGDE